MTIDLDQLEATAKAATPGTWYAVDDWDGFTFVTAGTAIAEVLPSNRSRGEDAEHIAAARPEMVLALIERLRKAEAPRVVTDAQVLAALNATVKPEAAAPDLSYWGDMNTAVMRAALEAAEEVRS